MQNDQSPISTRPNFLIIGAAQAKTLSLYSDLRQHPDIYFAPNVEPGYFAYANHPLDFAGIGDQQSSHNFTTTTYDDYIAQFSQWQGEKAVGEASTAYLYHPISAPHIHRFNPHMKLIVMLRHPADRAYAAYAYLRRMAREPATDFQMALDLECHRIINNWDQVWHYVSMGFYGEQIERYLSRFPRQQMLFLLFEDFERQPFATLRRIYKFLDVDHTFAPIMSIHPGKTDSASYSSWLKRTQTPYFLYRMRRGRFSVPKMPAEVRQQLTTHFQADIMRLQALIEKDLSGWLVD